MIGEKLRGRYRLDTRLGGGAQGEVFLAFDEHISRQIAIKVLKGSDPNSNPTKESIEKIRQEAIATAKFEHVNVVRVFDFQVTEEGLPFLVMEYLKGETGDKLPLPLSPELTRLLVRQVCAALQNAHDRGLVHRDLKPGNLMLVDRGKSEQRFVILDLGLAKVTDRTQQMQFTYSGAGTPLYMSPEQIDGKQPNGEPVDYRSDIYSFGTMLFEMLTGTTPFASKSESLGLLLRAVYSDPPPKLSDCYPAGNFSPELETLLKDCLEKQPDARPSSMQEVADRFLAAFEVSAPVIPVTAPPLKRWPWITGAIAMSVLGGAGFYFQPQLSQWMAPNSTGATGVEVVANAPSSEITTAASEATTPKVVSVASNKIPAPIVPPTVKNLVLAEISDRQVLEQTELVLQAVPMDPSIGGQLVYRLAGKVPAGATIDDGGRFQWTPSEEQGPGVYPITIVAQDIQKPSRKTTTEFVATVLEVNRAPLLEKVSDQTVDAGRKLIVALKATDPDLPRNTLSYRLAEGAPQGLKLDAKSGVLNWTPEPTQAGEDYLVTVSVADNAETSLAASARFKITVPDIPSPSSEKLFSNSIGMTLTRIEPGEFLMGSPDDEAGGHPRERPQHRVVFERPFYMGIHEVTQAEYRRVTGESPSSFKGPDADTLPVTDVSWNDANGFCRQLSELPEEKAAGRHYRLPTEAEWEYCCRAGSTTRFSFGDVLSEKFVAYNTDPDSELDSALPQPIGHPRLPNPWGLYDMHGNVFEWCADFYDDAYYKSSPEINPQGPKMASVRGKSDGNERVVRGGSFQLKLADEKFFRSALRTQLAPEIRRKSTGFRVVCDQMTVAKPE